jgi:hypothetical protein
MGISKLMQTLDMSMVSKFLSRILFASNTLGQQTHIGNGLQHDVEYLCKGYWHLNSYDAGYYCTGSERPDKNCVYFYN